MMSSPSRCPSGPTRLATPSTAAKETFAARAARATGRTPRGLQAGAGVAGDYGRAPAERVIATGRPPCDRNGRPPAGPPATSWPPRRARAGSRKVAVAARGRRDQEELFGDRHGAERGTTATRIRRRRCPRRLPCGSVRNQRLPRCPPLLRPDRSCTGRARPLPHHGGPDGHLGAPGRHDQRLHAGAVTSPWRNLAHRAEAAGSRPRRWIQKEVHGRGQLADTGLTMKRCAVAPRRDEGAGLLQLGQRASQRFGIAAQAPRRRAERRAADRELDQQRDDSAS